MFDEALAGYIERQYLDSGGIGPLLVDVWRDWFPHSELDLVKLWFAARSNEYRIVVSHDHPDGRVYLEPEGSQYSTQSTSTMSGASFMRQQQRPQHGNQQHGITALWPPQGQVSIASVGQGPQRQEGQMNPAVSDGSGRGGQNSVASGRGGRSRHAAGAGQVNPQIPKASIEGSRNQRRRQQPPKSPRFQFPAESQPSAFQMQQGSNPGGSNGVPAGGDHYPPPPPRPSRAHTLPPPPTAAGGSTAPQPALGSTHPCTLCNLVFDNAHALEEHSKSEKHVNKVRLKVRNLYN